MQMTLLSMILLKKLFKLQFWDNFNNQLYHFPTWKLCNNLQIMNMTYLCPIIQYLMVK